MLKKMTDRTICRNGLALLVLCTALPVLADTQFRVRRMARDDVPLGKGQCDIRLQIDGEAEVSVRGDMVYIRTISGRDGRDDGNSECNEPLPNRDVQGFNFEVKESRNEIRLLAEPSRRNNFSAIVRIRDTSGGEGRYHFRLSWQMTGSGGFPGERRGLGIPPDDRRGGPGFSWNNTIDFRGQGRGTSTHNTYGVQRLSDVTVNIDRSGRMMATFRTDRGRPLSFTGAVIGSEGGRLKADVVSDDGRLRGSMFISVDERRNVNSITLEATDGRDRLRLTWDRR